MHACLPTVTCLVPIYVVFHTLHNGTVFACNAILIEAVKQSHVSDDCWHQVVRNIHLLVPSIELHKPLQTGSASAGLT